MYYLTCHLSKCAVTIVKALLKFSQDLQRKKPKVSINPSIQPASARLICFNAKIHLYRVSVAVYIAAVR